MEKKVIVLGVGRKGCIIIEYTLTHKIDGVAYAYMSFHSEPDLFDDCDDSLKFNLQSVN